MGVINMPRRDGTGPNGKGPKTGRGAGPCKPGSKQTTKTRRSTKRGTRRNRRSS